MQTTPRSAAGSGIKWAIEECKQTKDSQLIPREIITPSSAKARNSSQFFLSIPKSAIHPASYFMGNKIGRATNFRLAARQSHLLQNCFSSQTMLQRTGRDQPHPHQGHATTAA
ncbi:hypothetical protein Nepgr_033546 [Nepenthes gracilis]|uniref:Uncharacterized protein n=1 Tax=Nepenthes gracilis TaxID=150966 RepID=A0AAD3TLM4_NEPGR|nr:hypothetical protein Nepgr_033546 [Nepenthes gracilis]